MLSIGFRKPDVVISKCLGFGSCRYNGIALQDEFIEKLKKYVNFRPVCPEVEMGLGVPRYPIRMVLSDGKERLVQPATKRDVTSKMNRFLDRFLNGLKDVDGFILKNRSPSCGLNDVRIYYGTEKGSGYRKGSGALGRKVLEAFPALAIEDEGRLKNFRLREHFLTKLYTLESFRRARKKNRMAGLVDFHSRNKFLFMGYSQKGLAMLGNIVANREGNPVDGVYRDYLAGLGSVMSEPPRRSSMGNVMQHVFGYFSKKLSDAEKRFFMETIGLYREHRIPFTSALNVLKAWALRHGDDYIEKQTLFEPYPEELMELTEGGKPLEI
ncbi:DUF1722 domain-containing protein [Candidatus Micrarchaeota archaeon]|nr:DUF1722 domain-containing protein [Candidatus Micrarchaeota archaeon]